MPVAPRRDGHIRDDDDSWSVTNFGRRYEPVLKSGPAADTPQNCHGRAGPDHPFFSAFDRQFLGPCEAHATVRARGAMGGRHERPAMTRVGVPCLRARPKIWPTASFITDGCGEYEQRLAKPRPALDMCGRSRP